MDCRNRTSRAVDGGRWAVISHQSSVFADSGCSPVGQRVSPAWGGTVEKQKLGKQKAEMGLRDHGLRGYFLLAARQAGATGQVASCRADPINRRWRRYTQIKGPRDY